MGAFIISGRVFLFGVDMVWLAQSVDLCLGLLSI